MGAGNHPGTRKGRERGPRHGGNRHHGRHHDPHPGRAHHDWGTSAAPPQPNTPRHPGAHPPTHTTEANIGRHADHTSAHPPATGNHTENGGHTYTGRTGHTHRGSHRERRRTAHHQATTPATTRATSQAPEEDEGMAAAPWTRDWNPQRARDQGTGPQGGQPHGPSRDRPTRPTSPSGTPKPDSTDPARHPHLTAPPSHQPATLRPALRTTTQARLTSTDPPRHHARPRHTAPQRATVQRATARRDATRHRAAQHDTTDPNNHTRTPLKAPRQHATHQHRRTHTGPQRAWRQRWRTTQRITAGTAEGKGHEQPQPPNPKTQAAAWRSRPAGKART